MTDIRVEHRWSIESKIGGVLVTLRRGGPVPPETYPQSAADSDAISTTPVDGLGTSTAVDERRQRDFELTQAITAARALQARLELLGDRAADVAIAHSLRDSLARDLADLGRER